MGPFSTLRPTTRFVILAVPRTGSNWLCTLLNSHPEILCHHELFNPQGIFTALTHRHQECLFGSLAERDRNPRQFLQRVWRSGEGYPCIGFKWTLGQDETVLESMVRDAGVKKLLLRRRNRIKIYVSEMIARQTQQWEVYSPADLMTPRPRVTVEPSALWAHVDRTEQFYGAVRSSLQQGHQPWIELEYESLHEAGEQQRMLTFLRVQAPEHPLTPESVRQNPTDLRQIIANFDDLAAALRESPLRKELDDCED